MSPLITSFKIWVTTILVNAALFGLIELATGNWPLILLALALGTMGFVIGFPFWMITWILVKCIMGFSYSATGRICWLASVLGMLVALFYMYVNWVIGDDFSLHEPLLQLLTGTTIAALIAALYWNRKAFVQLNNQ